MKNFNWEEFKNGKIAVHCDTEEKANSFLKECDENNISWVTGLRATDHNNFDTYNDKICYSCRSNGLTYASREFYRKEGMKIIKWEVKELKELTFREVIANIKEGEVWESDIKIIKCSINGNISVRSKIDNNSQIMNFNKDNLYKLKREEYTFQEAFKAYEEGKEIESCYTATKFCENEYLKNDVYSDWKLGVRFKVDEIKGKWYINEVD